MNPVVLAQPTLWRTLTESRATSLVLGVLLMVAASKICIPIKPVPITLGSAAALLLGLTYTPRAAFETLAIWLGLAACGLPVISSPALLGPSSGYLLGCLIAAPMMAYLLQKTAHSAWFLLLTVLLGNIIIYGCGIAWLTNYMDLLAAVQVGFLPFILPGCVKALLLAAGVRLVRQK
jgi:biotin transport system substrate-specific component